MHRWMRHASEVLLTGFPRLPDRAPLLPLVAFQVEAEYLELGGQVDLA